MENSNKTEYANIELARSLYIKRMYREYIKLCNEYFGWRNEPKNSFGRWLVLYLNKNNIDYLIPSTDELIKPNPMTYEIKEDYPGKIKPLLEFIENKKNLIEYINKYIFTYKIFMKKVNHKDDDNFVYLNELNSLKNFVLENDFNISKFKMIELKHKINFDLIKQYGHLADEIELKIMNLGILYANKIKKLTDIVSKVSIVKNGNKITLICNFDEQVIDISLYQKLKSNVMSNFIIWKMLKRYDTFANLNNSQGLHAAVPHNVMNKMNELFNVDFECFASPINHYFPNYCSLFYDTDHPFGSYGSFFNCDFDEGSFEANPPFEETIMYNMVKKIIFSLKNAKNPLSFMIILPEWEDSEAIIKLNKSKFLRKKIVIEKNKHKYRSMDQISHFDAVHNTLLFIIQNNEGFKKWKPTKKKIETLVQSFYD